MRNESETRAELIDPLLHAAGWGVVEGSRIRREYYFTDGRIQPGSPRAKPEKADYVLVFKNQNIGLIEAKAESFKPTEGVTQAKSYAKKLQIGHTYSTNGREIYEIAMKTGKEGTVLRFPTPEELWGRTFADWNDWKERFSKIPFETVGGTKTPRYYQELATNRVLDAISEEKNRILLTLATGTGKTFIAFQIAWKLFRSKWNLRRDAARSPRILFLADRNILADQAKRDFNVFSMEYGDDALRRIEPAEIRKKGEVPKSGAVFFTIFQTFLSGPENTPYFGDYPADFFDLIIIDECHRGGANDESTWRAILEYFSPAVQLGLTATPKRKDNVDTYKYFGDPVYVYSLKEGINDGFLTPFKVKRISTTLDDYVYTSDDTVIEGEVEEGRIYEESDFNRIIEIEERERNRVRILMNEMDQSEKTIVFGATQDHALALRDLINQMKKNPDPEYCVRVTANDAARGEQYLRAFQDNEKTIPTVLTTSQKLSTGVDARNIRNIVLLRPIKQMIEFKQIIGRGTRLFEGKEYFTIYDFVDAYKHFADPEWDGDPVDETAVGENRSDRTDQTDQSDQTDRTDEPQERPTKLRIKLRDGKEREIQHMIQTSFWSADGKPLSVQEFMESMFAAMPQFFKNEEELRKIWSDPRTRKTFLESIAALGYGKDELETLQRMLDAQECDLLDVLSYISFLTPRMTRAERVEHTRGWVTAGQDANHQDFLQFVLLKYLERGVDELGEEQLPILLNLKYHTPSDALKVLGSVDKVRGMFFGLQKSLYAAR
ncbi:MAG: DEAD/DEAH box helicase family protein [Bacteroidota bacterium]|nr:DEAD/DEAH box helicase family protein [Bacteroidota bacterium]MDP4231731.1 DEAD/DEAH box helicase family protein [Bacteroidota bacterium]MDP4243467.1 DEAD/DEAH box helicase family protein [Bacteroidota bacterium]MDP4289368.1 DEAD/DEAH box helicase family protein [Bacteroidota bacterium]